MPGGPSSFQREGGSEVELDQGNEAQRQATLGRQLPAPCVVLQKRGRFALNSQRQRAKSKATARQQWRYTPTHTHSD